MTPLTSAQRRFARWALLATVIVFAGGYVAEGWFSARWQIAFTPTKSLCLPWRVMLGDATFDGRVERGDLVWFHPDIETIQASSSATLPFKTEHKFMKFVAGVPGDTVEVGPNGVWVAGRYWGELDLLRKLKRDAEVYYRTEVVPPGHVFVMGSAPNSFDSRYWGPVPLERIIGRGEALL